ncbi:hypothetical protein HG537_0C01220 [Torulaspora globosa]|uniref:FAD-binding FR-type domain-containing protein n=1 Tax=Torulaspora globosa TaxID=48254 RepID=A0A7H9HSW4_9SACH|nr:hypothetical protein HG537_0C01220 [Torulaspora sp. CBS 2947]
MRLVIVLVQFYIFGLAYCSDGYVRYNSGDYVAMACQTAVEATFCSAKFKSNCSCVNMDSLGSYVYCGYQEARNAKEKRSFERYLMHMCDGLTEEKIAAAYENVTNYLADSTKVEGFNKTKIINYPVYYNKETFGYAYLSNKYRWQNFDRAIAWGSGLLGFWAILILFGGIDHWVSRLFPAFSMNVKRSIGRWNVTRLLRKHVSLPALFNNKHMTRNFIQGMIPTRLETIILSLFFCLLVIGEATNIHYLPHGTIWKGRRIQLTRYVGDRTGVISIFLMLPTYLFAGRNNFLLWITGWKQSTFYTYHKWLARMTIMSSFVHVLTMLLNSYWNNNKITTRKYKPWWRWGSVAMVAGGIMFFQSMAILRTRCYELFLYIHILMAVLFLCGVWIHLSYFAYTQWAYAAAAIWCFDRFLRLFRIGTMGIRTAQASVISDEIIMLTMKLGPKFKKPTAGSFGYIYFCKSWLFFQSHPFTVLQDNDGNIKFLIKVKNGVTRRLYSQITSSPENSCAIKVALEGFYGEYKPAFAYDQVLMIASGNGIPGLYEYITDIHEKRIAGKSKTKFIKLHWVIRNWHSLDWFFDELKTLQQYDFVQTVVYVTRYHDAKPGPRFETTISTNSSINNSTTNEKTLTLEKEVSLNYSWLEPITKQFPHIIFKDSRPDLAQLIHSDIQEVALQDNIAVMTCAHHTMCDDVRRTLAYEAGELRNGRIELFELLQGW